MRSDDPSNKNSLPNLIRSGFAGGIAGCAAKTVVAPLDRVKILFQASNPDFQKYAGSWSGAFKAASKIYGEAGARGLLQGHSATLLRIFPYASIKFMMYDQAEHILMPTPESQTNIRRFVAGAISGTSSVFLTYPLELIRVRMAFQTRSSSHPTPISPGKLEPPPPRPSFLHAMSEIYREGASVPPPSTSSTSSSLSSTSLFTRFPILKFYRGFTVSIVGMVPYAGTSFLTWGFLRAYFLPPAPPSSSSSPHKPKVSPLTDLACGAVAGAVSQTASYPFEVIRRRMQVGGLTHPDRWMRWGDTVRAIWRAGGWHGFYVGLSIGYLKIVPMTATSFAAWQWLKGVLGP